ncbi:MAG TPA: GatB/YqeY domain-containing protein [Patescibacteria group bacterium]|nr:GatB/YqeY domain-containing protein [Patescibacteria group bacterium]
MALTEQIQKDLIEAMKARDELRASVLRMVKTALKMKEVEKTRPLDDAESTQVLQTLVKQRRESIEQFRQGGRDDLADREAQEISVLEAYLPAAPTDSEMQAAIEAAIMETAASSPKQMGAVIKAARAHLEGKAVDGKLLSERVRQRLEKNA